MQLTFQFSFPINMGELLRQPWKFPISRSAAQNRLPLNLLQNSSRQQ
jgi:hypothetical protein